jgi:hypothetical protein
MKSTSVLYHPLLWWVFITLSSIHLMSLFWYEEYIQVVLFVLGCGLASFFSKNMVVILCIGLVVSALLLPNQGFSTEGFRKRFSFGRLMRQSKIVPKFVRNIYKSAAKAQSRSRSQNVPPPVDPIANSEIKGFLASSMKIPDASINVKKDTNRVSDLKSANIVQEHIENDNAKLDTKVQSTATMLKNRLHNMQNNVKQNINKIPEIDNNCYYNNKRVSCKLYATYMANEVIKKEADVLYDNILPNLK